MKKLLLSAFVMCAMYELAWSRIERVCIAPAGCQIIMSTGECPECIDKFYPDVITDTYEEAKVKEKKVAKKKPVQTKRKSKCIIPPCDDWIDSDGNLIVKN